jgi:TPR repeat protein
VSDESQLRVTRAHEKVGLSKVRSGLIARGRRDVEVIVSREAEPVDPLDEGSPYAQYELGRAYEKGEGVPQDFTEAAKWYRKAAEQGSSLGSSISMPKLARLYRDGRGVPQNFAEALHWYAKAASSEHYADDAKVELGLSYWDGIGTAEDYGEAVKWFRDATPSTMGYAELYMAYAYANGHGVCQDYAEAVRWWKIAADGEELTCGSAHQMLGHAYYCGDGVPQDYILAYMWYALATAYLDDEDQGVSAKSSRDDVAMLLTPEQLEEARRLAHEWHAERFGPNSGIDVVMDYL